MLSQSILTCCALIAISVALWNHPNLSGAEGGGRSCCIDCHTNLKKLIKLCWQIEALKPKSRKSEETTGEG